VREVPARQHLAKAASDLGITVEVGKGHEVNLSRGRGRARGSRLQFWLRREDVYP
jgi:hypothetical protein